MGKKQRLGNVLKLTGNRKWAFFQRINTNREDDLLETISIKNKTDAASVSQLAKLIAVEQTKGNYDHVVTLIRTIRRCFMDDERVIRVLVNEGLDKVVLASISALRKQATQEGMNVEAPTLRLLLANISDMFEWQFFGDGNYKNFVEEVLSILTSCNDCDDSLFSEAASVMMSMCTTNISTVFDCLAKAKPQTSMLERVLHDLPRAKSFFYEALVLEIIYRLYRYSKKANEPTTVVALIDSFPVQIARALPQIPPKAFRDETRRLLNEFNASVGVITSLKLKAISCSSAGAVHTEIELNPTGWIDLGGTILEIEVTLLVDKHEVVSTIKLPYKKITSVTSMESTQQVALTVSKFVGLTDVMDGLNDPRLANSTDVRMCLTFDGEACTRMIVILDQRMKARSSDEYVTIESATLGALASPHTWPSSARCQSVAPTHAIDRLSSENEPSQRASDSPLSGKETSKRLRPQSDTDVEPHAFKHKKKIKIITVHTKTKSKQPCSETREAEAPRQNFVDTAESDAPNRKDGDGDRVEMKLLTDATQRHTTTSEPSKRCQQKRFAAVVQDEEELREEAPQRGLTETVTQKQTFRSRQAQHLHQLQSLVEDIVKTNDQFRHFNIASLCHQVSEDAEALLEQKRVARDSVDAFDEIYASVLQSEAKRGDLSRGAVPQDAMKEVIKATALTETRVSARAEELMTEIQRTVDQESRHQLDRVQKKLRVHATQCYTQAKEKLTAIEKSFNTDDLRVVQQMLQRI